jgi:hypothetical protein
VKAESRKNPSLFTDISVHFSTAEQLTAESRLNGPSSHLRKLGVNTRTQAAIMVERLTVKQSPV